MTSRELFIQEIETFISKGDIILPEAAMLYFESLKNAPSKEPKLITENGMKISDEEPCGGESSEYL